MAKKKSGVELSASDIKALQGLLPALKLIVKSFDNGNKVADDINRALSDFADKMKVNTSILTKKQERVLKTLIAEDKSGAIIDAFSDKVKSFYKNIQKFNEGFIGDENTDLTLDVSKMINSKEMLGYTRDAIKMSFDSVIDIWSERLSDTAKKNIADMMSSIGSMSYADAETIKSLKDAVQKLRDAQKSTETIIEAEVVKTEKTVRRVEPLNLSGRLGSTKKKKKPTTEAPTTGTAIVPYTTGTIVPYTSGPNFSLVGAPRTNRPANQGVLLGKPYTAHTSLMAMGATSIISPNMRQSSVHRNVTDAVVPYRFGAPMQTFDQERERENQEQGRKKFISELIAAFLAKQKKNPIADLLKLAVLYMGKYFPPIAAGALMVGSFVALFKGFRVVGTVFRGFAQIVSRLLGATGVGRAMLGTSALVKTLTQAFKAGGLKGLTQALNTSFKASNFGKALTGFAHNPMGALRAGWNATATFAKGIPGATANFMKGAPNMLKGAGRAGLGILKGAGRLGASALGKIFGGPIGWGLLGYDLFSGWQAAKDGNVGQRLAGSALKGISFGMMSDERIRKIVGLDETKDALSRLGDTEDKKLGLLSRFFNWLKSILPWGKKDDPNTWGDTRKDIKNEKETRKMLEKNLEKNKKELESDKFKVGTKAFDKLHKQYRKEYAESKYDPNNPVTKGAQISAYMNSEEANKYAINKIASDYKALQTSVKQAEQALHGGNIYAVGSSLYNSKANTFGGKTITSHYGSRVHPVTGERKFHHGIDLAYNTNEDVKAFTAGKVTFAGKKGGYGNTIVVTDANGIQHLYAHNNALNYKVGDAIRAGDVIAQAGSTGTSTGTHVHYETRDAKGRSFNPLAMGASSAAEFNAMMEQTKAERATTTAKAETAEQASSGIREALAKHVGVSNATDRYNRAQRIIFSQSDVTGSLGCWGITQRNNRGSKGMP